MKPRESLSQNAFPETAIQLTQYLIPINELFSRHYQGIGFDWKMRRCSDAPTKDSPMFETASPERAGDYLMYFITPYLQLLQNVQALLASPDLKAVLAPSIKQRVTDSINAANQYAQLLREFSQVDINNPRYNEIVQEIHGRFMEVSEFSIRYPFQIQSLFSDEFLLSTADVVIQNTTLWEAPDMSSIQEGTRKQLEQAAIILHLPRDTEKWHGNAKVIQTGIKMKQDQ